MVASSKGGNAMNAYHISLSPSEEETLTQMYQFAPKRRLRQRAHMVLLSNDGYCQKEIAKIVSVDYCTARRYVHQYNLYGLAALYDADIPGRPSQLSDDQFHQIDIWLNESPRQIGYNQSNWTARLMKHHIFVTFGIQLSGETVRRIFHRLGYSLVRPRHNNDHLADEAEKKRQLMSWTPISNAPQMEKFASFSSMRSNSAC
jgi:transposase|tara:strand:- start:497 stop:1102 length:606 start_codon:yes stop_codon:yes gene_type:complete